MKSKAKAATVAEKERMARLKEMPCVACSIKGVSQCQPTEVHHLISGNRRRGHVFTIPLCMHHHRGFSRGTPYTPQVMEQYFGPSLALASKAFRQRFGTDDELLARTNQLLEKANACGT